MDDVDNISPLQELNDSLEYFYFQTGTKQGIIGAETIENIRLLLEFLFLSIKSQSELKPDFFLKSRLFLI